MRIQHNIMAMNAYRNYTNNVAAMKKNLEKLSSGYRINRAGDDAAGLAISEKMRAQITGLETAQKNAKDGISLVQTAEGALTEVHDMLNRMVELATQSANGTYDNDTDRFQLQKEMDQLRTEINRIADSANFNGIKLFDGSLSGADITTTGIDVSQIDMAKGVEVVQGTNGGGSNGVYTINLDTALTDGDVLTFTFAGDVTTANGMGAGTTTKVLTYGTGGNVAVGKTLQEQAENIAKALKGDSGISKHFEVSVDGTAVTLKARVEGNKLSDTSGAGTDTDVTSSLLNVEKTTDKKASQGAATTGWDETQAGADATDGEIYFATLFESGDNKGMNISDGDTIEFEVTLTNGTTAKLTAVAGKDFEIGKDHADTSANFVNFLNSDSAVFEDDAGTVVDESKIKFKDIFTASVESDTTDLSTGLKLAVSSGIYEPDADVATNIKISNTKKDGTYSTYSPADGTGLNGAQGTVADNKATTYKIDLKTGAATDAANLTIGDKLTIEGKLTDGRTFKFDVEAGKDFDVADSYANTLGNLKTLLESSSFNITLKDDAGNETQVKGSDIFGANAEITFDNTAHTFTSNSKGALASAISKVTLTNGEDLSVSTKLNNGEQRTSADSVITFTDGVEYGAVVEVGGKNYELVKSAGDVSSSNNKAVVVDDISDLNSIAKALADSIKGDLSSADYKVTTSNNKVTVATTKVGSTAQAVSASASGDKTTQIEFTLDPKKMQAGSTVTINGQTYEFVGKGGKPTDKANQTIEVADFSKETASSLGSALAKLANGQNSASVTVDGDGKVTVRGLVDGETNKIVTPTVKFDGGTSGLTLQIGDTAEDFNKMTVSIYNMHTADMGIGDIRIDNQEDAAAAIDKIKSAINYVSDVRGTLGATQNRLDHTINNLSVMTENIQDAESTIRDTDVAAEMMAYTKNNILIQSAQAMLAQANQVPQGVLQLLQ